MTQVQVNDKLARVTLANGRVLEAEHVLLTAPPSVWNRIAFDPLLPLTLMPQMGSNIKCLIALKNRFWRNADLAPDSFTDGPLHMTWDGTDGQPGAGAALVCFSGGPAAEQCTGMARRRRASSSTWRRWRRCTAASDRAS